ncbi:Set1/Ash2 histone methyltransferase complex subunit ASH2 [Papilio machaon]|uniref:Set1/Ash2 histone methyltransferase complex subunit ASH2 n=1 Tax=Papilio machaon TaxID=76193 RepID=A0A194QM08_PAPMA|nr:Set1/Ash2 histone methyltransferase complex subunit ASH2 [Papilio machaon]
MSLSDGIRKSIDMDITANNSQNSESQKAGENGEKSKNKSAGDPQQSSCYCGKERNLNIVELLCASCNRWFHESCIGYQLGKLVPFMTNYLFICKNCSPTGLETFKKNQAPFPQMCLTAIANLQQESSKEGNNKMLFSKDREIIPYIDQYWEAMTTMPRRPLIGQLCYWYQFAPLYEIIASPPPLSIDIDSGIIFFKSHLVDWMRWHLAEFMMEFSHF